MSDQREQIVTSRKDENNHTTVFRVEDALGRWIEQEVSDLIFIQSEQSPEYIARAIVLELCKRLDERPLPKGARA